MMAGARLAYSRELIPVITLTVVRKFGDEILETYGVPAPSDSLVA